MDPEEDDDSLDPDKEIPEEPDPEEPEEPENPTWFVNWDPFKGP